MPDDRLPEAPTYFDRPLLKAPHWGSNVVSYLFLGGVMGGLSVLALISREDREDERRLRRSARYASLILAAINPLILISHLGRPERFFMMLRIAKFKSPMSLGVWGLVLFSALAGANVARELIHAGKLPRWGRKFVPGIATPLQAIFGAFISGYTGVLLSATAIPLWGAGKRHIPSFSVCSGFAGACALSSLLALVEGNDRIGRKLERFELVAATAEFAILADFKRSAGAMAAPMFEGARGEKLRTVTVLGGIVVPLVLNAAGSVFDLPKSIDTGRIILAASLTLLGGYVLRETLIEAGKASARDPRVASRQPV